MRRQPQVRDLIGEIERIAEDLHRLRQAGDEAAATGAASVLQAALLELASTPAGRNSDVRSKARCVQMHMTTSKLDRVGLAMVNAALAADARAWSIGKTGH